jgi:hypothetical protein
MDNTTTNSNSNLSQIVGIIGAIFAILGTFFPLISIPIMGSISMIIGADLGFNSETTRFLLYSGIFIIILSLISIGLIFKRGYGWVLFFVGLTILSIIAFVYFKCTQLLAEYRSQSPRLPGTLFTNSISFDFGWAALIIGGILICISAYFTQESEENNEQ